jgi:hypothetical protein
LTDASLDCLAHYAPKIYSEYVTKLNALQNRYPSLRRNFIRSIYPSVTFNLGPAAVCKIHLDVHNDPTGYCPITSAGTYNPLKGGHIVLYDLKLLVVFPPGSTVLIPSATMPHGNTPISSHETRYTMTQHCAGGLLRWIKYGFKTMKSYGTTKAGRELMKAMAGDPEERLQEALDRISKVDELASDQEKYLVFTD